MKYLVWKELFDDEFARLERYGPDEVDEILHIPVFNRKSMGNQYPENEMIWNLDSTTGKRVNAIIPNTSNIKVISNQFKVFLEIETNASFEFYPLSIRDGRGKILSEKYWIANLQDTVSCTDLDRSIYVKGRILKDQLKFFTRLVLLKDKIPKDLKIFRLGEATDTWIVEEELALKIRKEKEFFGNAFQYIEYYGEEYRGADYKPDPVAGY